MYTTTIDQITLTECHFYRLAINLQYELKLLYSRCFHLEFVSFMTYGNRLNRFDNALDVTMSGRRSRLLKTIF